MPDVNTERLQSMARQNYNLDYPAAMRLASGLSLDPNGICRTLYNKELNSCFEELLGDGSLLSNGLLTSHALLLDGSSGCWCTTPDAVALDILADIDIRIECQIFVGGAASQCLFSKWASGANRSWKVTSVFGLFGLHWSNNGTADLNDDNVTPPNAFTGSYRFTLDAVNGANHITESSYSSSGLGLGTPFDTNTVAGNTAIFNSTAVVGIGACDAGGVTDRMFGRVTRAQIRSAIDGTIVANPDFRSLAPGTTSFVDSAGLTWTLQGTAKIV